ncbi:MAG: type 3 dihydrofolate reductase [Zetaproteobacteria bacterium]|nr:type 3 dihydrofolate reductase [Zetaproteobacteria bacterium]
MDISLIWGMDKQRLIGCNNTLPWHLPADMQWFRQHTLGKPILMGRKTYESIGKPLPKRLNLILTRQKNLDIAGCTVVHSLEDATQATGDTAEIMVMGGAEIYQMCLPHANRLYITHIDGDFNGDRWFPDIDLSTWQLVYQEKHQPDEKNTYPYCFEIWER